MLTRDPALVAGVILAQALVFGIICASLAAHKGHRARWFWAGFFWACLVCYGLDSCRDGGKVRLLLF